MTTAMTAEVRRGARNVRGSVWAATFIRRYACGREEPVRRCIATSTGLQEGSHVDAYLSARVCESSGVCIIRHSGRRIQRVRAWARERRLRRVGDECDDHRWLQLPTAVSVYLRLA